MHGVIHRQNVAEAQTDKLSLGHDYRFVKYIDQSNIELEVFRSEE